MAMELFNVRMDRELWDAIQDKAAAEGRTASEAVREVLTAWVAKPPKQPARLKTWRDQD